MTLGLHNLELKPGAKKKSRRVGRGHGSGRGSYSGKGQKGQKARSGVSQLKRRGLKSFLHSKPKLGGFKSYVPKMTTVDLDQLSKVFGANEVVTPKKLVAKGLVRTVDHGVKILGSGKLTKKLVVIADTFSAGAKDAILKAGGKVEFRRK